MSSRIEREVIGIGNGGIEKSESCFYFDRGIQEVGRQHPIRSTCRCIHPICQPIYLACHRICLTSHRDRYNIICENRSICHEYSDICRKPYDIHPKRRDFLSKPTRHRHLIAENHETRSSNSSQTTQSLRELLSQFSSS